MGVQAGVEAEEKEEKEEEEEEEEMAAAVEAGEADAALVVACRKVGVFLQVAADLALALRPRRRNNHHQPRRARRAPSTAGASHGTSGSTERSVGLFSGRGLQAAIGVHGTA